MTDFPSIHLPLESQSIAWPSGADHADEIASRSLPESLNRLKCQFWETYFNWKRRRLEDNHNNIQEPVSNAFQCPWYSIVALPAHCEVKNIEQHGGRALEVTQTLGAALDIPQGEGRVVKFDDTVEHADWYAMADFPSMQSPCKSLSVPVLPALLGLFAILFVLKNVVKTYRKNKKRKAPSLTLQRKRLKSNNYVCNKMSINCTTLVHQQSNHVVSGGFRDIFIGVSDRYSIATTSRPSCYVGLRIMSTRDINALLQRLPHIEPFRNSLLGCHLNVHTETLLEQMNGPGLHSPRTARGLLELQALCHEMPSKSPVEDPQSFINTIGFAHNQSDCCRNAWITLFRFYFNLFKLSSHYRGLEVFQIGEQPQVFSCLQVYVSNIGIDKINLTLLQILSEEYNTTSPRLVHVPEVLIILLNRMRNNKGKVEKDCCSVAFPSELDIGNCCNASDVSSKYRVRGAIFHDGEEVLSGHYRAAIKNFDNDKWVVMNGHQVEVFDLSVPHEHAAFAKQTCQPDMLLYVSSKFMDVYREDDKRFRSFFEKEQSVQSNSNPTTLGRIPTAHQNHSLNIFNKVDSSNENVAQNSPNSNFPIEHLESNCSRVEIVRGDSSDSSPAIERVEQDQSSFQQENQSVSHNINSTTIDIQNITVDDFAVEDDSNISDMDLEDALSTQMSSSRATSIFDDVPLLNHDWEIASVSSLFTDNSDKISPRKNMMHNNPERTASLTLPHSPSKEVRNEHCSTWTPNSSSSLSALQSPVLEKVVNRRSLRKRAASVKHPKRQEHISIVSQDERWDQHFEALKQYKESEGTCAVPKRRKWTGLALGRWVCEQRIAHSREKLAPERFERLEAIGFHWNGTESYRSKLEENFNDFLNELVKYKIAHGNCCVPCNFPENPKLGRWVERQRARCKPSTERYKLLEAMGFWK
ncbi:hypothetical protein ACHAW6_011789 [Cyclotella cf. meneghiniana]